jgi:hypothetical protein
MPIPVTLNNKSFLIPTAGEEGYAEELTAYLTELAVVANSFIQPLDILPTNFNFSNNQVAPADVTGLSFPTASVVGVTIDYVITRDNGTKITEKGNLYAYQGETNWHLAQGNVLSDSPTGDVGILFSITSDGQVQYTSTNYAGQTSGIITFTAKTQLQ